MGHAFRGMAFERLIEKANKQYEDLGIAIVEKQEIQKKVFHGEMVYMKKGAPDFIGFGPGGQGIAFDAKSIEGKNLPLKMIVRRIHQYYFLQKAEQLGAKAFYLVEFKNEGKVFILPLDQVTAAIERHKSGGRASIPLEEFKIEVGSHEGISLDYLQIFKE